MKYVLVLAALIAAVTTFEVPEATVEVLEPQGFKVSIPALEGIKLFAFHGNLNTDLNGREGGQFSSDVNSAVDGRWTYINRNTKLKPGDVLNFWTYVDYYDGVNKLGYALDDQEYVVRREVPVPSQTTPPVTPIIAASFAATPELQPVSAQQNNPNCKPSVTTASGTYAPKQICSGDLIFSDEFDDFDLQKWQHANTLGGNGNWEFQWYNNNRTNSFVKDGKLHIHPTLLSDQFGEKFLTSGTLDINGGAPADRCTNPAYYGCSRTGSPNSVLNPTKSALVSTLDSFSYKYGRLEIGAKTPVGDWMWPALWLVPRYNAYGSWPASGEIDLLESRGNARLIFNGRNIGTPLATTTLHFGPDHFHNGFTHAFWEKKAYEPYNTKFQKFTMIWTPESLSFYYGEEKIGFMQPPAGGFWELGEFEKSGLANPWTGGTIMAPFDQEFYLVINVAIGGINGFFPETRGKPWNNVSPNAQTEFYKAKNTWWPSWNTGTVSDHSFQIDYVRIYAL